MAWTLPCAGRVTSPFGPRILAAGMFPFHYGVDVRAGRGPIFAAQAGVVRSIWITTKGGWVVDIRHADEGGRQIRTRYIHMYRNEIRVGAGQQVRAGDWIGNSGESGSPGSPHLHFEVMVNGALVDPVPFLATRGLTFGVSLVSNVIGGVGVPPSAPAGTLPDPLTPEDDMLTDADRLILRKDMLEQAEKAVANRVADIVARTTAALLAADVGAGTLSQAVRDARVIARRTEEAVLALPTPSTPSVGTIDYAALAKAVADEAARRLAS